MSLPVFGEMYSSVFSTRSKAMGNDQVADVVIGRQKFDAFDVAVETVAPMPAND